MKMEALHFVNLRHNRAKYLHEKDTKVTSRYIRSKLISDFGDGEIWSDFQFLGIRAIRNDVQMSGLGVR